MESFTSEANLLTEGTLLPFSPNQILFSCLNSSNRSLVSTQHLPSGGYTDLPLGVIISYIFSSIAGPTDKSLDFQGPL